MKNKDALGGRMKDYENVMRLYLTKRLPTIVRIDGRAFHTFTKGLNKPFDDLLTETMQLTAKELCATITGCKLAYIQSDEISLLLTDYETIDTKPWFDNNLQKLVSVSASIATAAFNGIFYDKSQQPCGNEDYNKIVRAKAFKATFDSRAFILPKEEVCNYFIWRQQDATRNSILSIAQSLLPASEIHGKTCDELQDAIFIVKHINWNDYPTTQKRGSCVVKAEVNVNGTNRQKWIVDNEIPVFTKDRSYIDQYVYPNDTK